MIRIGVGTPLSGSSAALGAEMKQAVELAVEERNLAGGFAGAVLGVEAVDDEGRVDRGEAVARAFCANPEVLGLIGHYNSDVMLATMPLYRESGLAVIMPIVSNPAATGPGLPNIFRFTNRDDQTGAAIAEYLFRKRGKRRAVVAETATTYGSSMAAAFSRAFLRRGGKVLAHHVVRAGEQAFAELVDACPADFDLLFYGGSFEGAPILRAMRAAGCDQLFAAGDGCWDVVNFLQPAENAATQGEGVLVLSATLELGRVPGSLEFSKRYTRRHGPIGNYAVNAYDSACLLIEAIDRAAATAGAIPSRHDVVAAVRAARFRGIAYRDPVIWDERGENLAAVTALYDIEGNRFHQVAEIANTVGTEIHGENANNAA